jgi:hypothetical protein
MNIKMTLGRIDVVDLVAKFVKTNKLASLLRAMEMHDERDVLSIAREVSVEISKKLLGKISILQCLLVDDKIRLMWPINPTVDEEGDQEVIWIEFPKKGNFDVTFRGTHNILSYLVASNDLLTKVEVVGRCNMVTLKSVLLAVTCEFCGVDGSVYLDMGEDGEL